MARGEQPRLEEPQQTGDLEAQPDALHGGDDDATALGPRIHASAWAAWATAAIRRAGAERLGRDLASRNRPAAFSVASNLDSGENIGRPAAVKPRARISALIAMPACAERFGQHRGGNRLAVNKHAIAIEDDQWSLRRYGRHRRPKSATNCSPEQNTGLWWQKKTGDVFDAKFYGWNRFVRE